jgi:hypothetical protein
MTPNEFDPSRWGQGGRLTSSIGAVPMTPTMTDAGLLVRQVSRYLRQHHALLAVSLDRVLGGMPEASSSSSSMAVSPARRAQLLEQPIRAGQIVTLRAQRPPARRSRSLRVASRSLAGALPVTWGGNHLQGYDAGSRRRSRWRRTRPGVWTTPSGSSCSIGPPARRSAGAEPIHSAVRCRCCHRLFVPSMGLRSGPSPGSSRPGSVWGIRRQPERGRQRVSVSAELAPPDGASHGWS